MPQSENKMFIHAVFSTDQRIRMIDEGDAVHLKAYCVGIMRTQKCPVLAIEILEDHVHILFVLSRTKAVATVMRELKSGSSRWLRQTKPNYSTFRWQSGYGAFSVSPSRTDETKRYILNQRAHHMKQSFADELDRILSLNGLNPKKGRDNLPH